MQLNPLVIYLWGIADSISTACFTLSILSGLAFAFMVAVSILLHLNNDDEAPKMRLYTQYAAKVFIALTIGAVFTPSSKTIAIMVVAPAIVNSEPIQKDIPELYQLAKEAMKEALGAKK